MVNSRGLVDNPHVVMGRKVRVAWFAPWFSSSRSRYLSTLPSDKFEVKIIVNKSHFDFGPELLDSAVVLPLAESTTQNIKNIFRIFRILGQFKPDLLIIDDVTGLLRSMSVLLLALKHNTTIAIDDVIEHDEMHRRPLTSKLLRKVLIRFSRKIIVFSENSKRDAGRLYPFAVVRNLPLIPEVSPQINNSTGHRNNFAMVGRWSDYKGFDLGIQIFTKYVRETGSVSKLELWCSGASDICIDSPNVIWRSRDKFAWDQLMQNLPNYRAILLPYRSATQSGVQVLAWSAGVPCLVSNLPGLEENQPASLSSLKLEDYDGWIECMKHLEFDSYVENIGSKGKIFIESKVSQTVVSSSLESTIWAYLSDRRL